VLGANAPRSLPRNLLVETYPSLTGEPGFHRVRHM